MRVTHKLVSRGYGTEWDLHTDIGGQVFFRLVGGTGNWFESKGSLADYRANPGFVVTKLNAFRGNK